MEMSDKQVKKGMEISLQIAEAFAQEGVSILAGTYANALLLEYARTRQPEEYRAVMKRIAEVTAEREGVTDGESKS